MEAYVLDDQLRRVQCVDLFNSFLWAERYSEKGDFILVLDDSSPAKIYFEKGTKIAIKDSYKIMTVDTVKRGVDANGATVITITGYSGENIFTSRVAKPNFDNLTVSPTWNLSGTPRDIMKEIVYTICVDGSYSIQDIIPYLIEGDLLEAPGTWMALPDLLFWSAAVGEWATAYGTSTTTEDPMDEVDISVKPQSIYETIKQICDVYGLGFRLVRNFDNSELYFEIYTGQDRTSAQTFYPTVRFSSDMDNLASSSEIDTEKDTANTAYVFSKKGQTTVYDEGTPSETATGFERKVIYVEVTDYDEDATEAAHQLVLEQRGREELAKRRPSRAFDGEITQNSSYVYGRDYQLGDLVELRSDNGTMSKMRVTEQIFVHDLSGDRSYPTLSVATTIDPKSWAAQPATLVWSAADGYWIDWA